MSENKNLSVILLQKKAIVFSILQILFATCAVLKIEKYHSDIQSCDMFRPTVLKQKYFTDYSDII